MRAAHGTRFRRGRTAVRCCCRRRQGAHGARAGHRHRQQLLHVAQVRRAVAAAREVGHLIVGIPTLPQVLARGQPQVGGIGARLQAARRRVLQLQQRDVVDAEVGSPVHVRLHVRRPLARHPNQEIEVQPALPPAREQLHAGPQLKCGMAPPEPAQRRVGERLYADREAIDTGARARIQQFRGHVLRVRLQGALGGPAVVGAAVNRRGQRTGQPGQQPPQLAGRQEAGRAAAHVQRRNRTVRDNGAQRVHFGQHGRHQLGRPLQAADGHRIVAVAAARRAERDMDVIRHGRRPRRRAHRVPVSAPPPIVTAANSGTGPGPTPCSASPARSRDCPASRRGCRPSA